MLYQEIYFHWWLPACPAVAGENFTKQKVLGGKQKRYKRNNSFERILSTGQCAAFIPDSVGKVGGSNLAL